MDSKKVKKELDAIIGQLKEYAEPLRPFFEHEVTLKEYPKQLHDFDVRPEHKKRQALITDLIQKKFQNLFGRRAETELHINVDTKLAFNIADHHQVLNHPVLLSANYVSSAHKFLQLEKQDAVIVISSGDVPPNNFFSKNGFQFHGKRVPIFSNSEREYTSYYIPKRDFDFVGRLKRADRWELFSQDEKSFLAQEQERIQSYDYSKCADYNDQITVIVRETWPRIFEERIRATMPELLYMTQEELVTQCLITLLKGDSIISQCLFDKKFRDVVLEKFRGIVVTWNEEESKGTHFFWRKYPDQSRSLRMYIQGNRLVPDDVRFADLAVSIDRDTIIHMLEKREIYPSLFMIFSVLNFYAGVKPLVGYGSLTYLAFMKDAWMATLDVVGNTAERELASAVETDGFVAGLALFFKKVGEKIQTLYAYDCVCDGGVTQRYLEKISANPFGDILSVSAPDLYAYYSQKYVPKKEKIKVSITTDEAASVLLPWL
ncbi:MAG: hypothetical protein AAB588_01950 [Patescibacteria group bacterium]